MVNIYERSTLESQFSCWFRRRQFSLMIFCLFFLCFFYYRLWLLTEPIRCSRNTPEAAGCPRLRIYDGSHRIDFFRSTIEVYIPHCCQLKSSILPVMFYNHPCSDFLFFTSYNFLSRFCSIQKREFWKPRIVYLRLLRNFTEEEARLVSW